MAEVGVAEDRRASILYDTEDWVGVEDWLTVLSGFFTVVFVLYLFYVGTRVEMPTFRWSTAAGFGGDRGGEPQRDRDARPRCRGPGRGRPRRRGDRRARRGRAGRTCGHRR